MLGLLGWGMKMMDVRLFKIPRYSDNHVTVTISIHLQSRGQLRSRMPTTKHFHKLASEFLMMSTKRPARPSSGVEPDMYDDRLYADDYYRGSAEGYQISRKGNR
jgi:hypothetical protein